MDAHCRSWGEVRVGRSCLFAMGAEVSSAYDVQGFSPEELRKLVGQLSHGGDEDGGTRKRNALFVFR